MSNRLKKLRREKGLTQADLAKVLNTNQSKYGKYENGKTNLSLENAQILSEYFGVTLSYLLGLDDDSGADEIREMKLSKLDPFEKTPNRIGELINSSDKSLKQISQEININYETLSAYKRQLRRPKKENAKILAEYFGVTLPYLLGLDDDSGTDGSKKMTPFQSLVRDRDLSLKEISEATGIAYPTLSGYNQGIRTPKKKNAKILAEYFGVSIPYLLGYEENFTANKPNATISIELVKELSFISEKKSKLLQEYIELDKKERDILEQIKEIVR